MRARAWIRGDEPRAQFLRNRRLLAKAWHEYKETNFGSRPRALSEFLSEDVADE